MIDPFPLLVMVRFVIPEIVITSGNTIERTILIRVLLVMACCKSVNVATFFVASASTYK